MGYPSSVIEEMRKGITKINANLSVRIGIIISELGLAPLIIRERQFSMQTLKSGRQLGREGKGKRKR